MQYNHWFLFLDCEWTSTERIRRIRFSSTNVPLVFRDDGITPVDAPEIFITEASDGRKILTATARSGPRGTGEPRGAAKDEAGGDASAPTWRSSHSI